MAAELKRKGSPSPETNGYTKRSRTADNHQSDKNGKEGSKVDPFTGMRVAFPGLDDAADEIFYGPPSDGLEYLRQVRSEAKTIPGLLVAPKADLEPATANTETEYGGYYDDGAYTAKAVSTARPAVDSSMHEHEPTEAEKDYHTSLTLKFRLMRADLRCLVLEESAGSLDETQHPTSFENDMPRHKKLRSTLLTSYPLPAQVAQFSQPLILKSLSILAGSVFGKQKNIPEGVSQWIWALLAQSDDVGCLSSEEVATLRDLAKRAGALCRRVKLAMDGIQADLDNGDGETGGNSEIVENPESCTGEEGLGQDAEISELEADATSNSQQLEPSGSSLTQTDILAAKKRILMEMSMSTSRDEGEGGERGFPSEPFPSEGTRTTLDFILTIVGELYGQRDLLVYRNILWQA